MKTIGKITKTYGFEGAVVVRSERGISREPVQGEPVFIVIDGLPVPFFTREAFSPTSDSLVISFEDYLTDKSVIAFKGCEVRTTDTEYQADDIDFTGFAVKDESSEFTGIITRVIAHPQQILAEVKGEYGDVLIPMHPDLIIKIDRKRRIIIMALPSGLTGINR